MINSKLNQSELWKNLSTLKTLFKKALKGHRLSTSEKLNTRHQPFRYFMRQLSLKIQLLVEIGEANQYQQVRLFPYQSKTTVQVYYIPLIFYRKTKASLQAKVSRGCAYRVRGAHLNGFLQWLGILNQYSFTPRLKSRVQMEKVLIFYYWPKQNKQGRVLISDANYASPTQGKLDKFHFRVSYTFSVLLNLLKQLLGNLKTKNVG